MPTLDLNQIREFSVPDTKLAGQRERQVQIDGHLVS